MILPQLEEGAHGAEVVGMFFFEDNNYVLVKGDPIGERLAKVARVRNILLMGCDQCCYSGSGMVQVPSTSRKPIAAASPRGRGPGGGRGARACGCRS